MKTIVKKNLFFIITILISNSSAREWTVLNVTSNPTTLYSMTIDKSDNPHFLYYGSEGITYATWQNSIWHINDNMPGREAGASLALDSYDRPHVAYTDMWDSDPSVNHAILMGDTWATEERLAKGTVGSLAIDEYDMPYIAYSTYARGLLHLAWKTGSEGSWLISEVDGIDYSSGFPRLALKDEGAGFYLTYWDELYDDLRITSTCNRGACLEHYTNYFSDRGISSLVLDSDNMPHVTFKDNSGSLVYTYLTNEGTWTRYTIPGKGMYGSLALDSNDTPFISFYDSQEEDFGLKLASWNGNSWDIETIDNDYRHITEMDTRLAIDSANRIHLSYFDFEGLKHRIGEVPEPCTFALLAIGGLALRKR